MPPNPKLSLLLWAVVMVNVLSCCYCAPASPPPPQPQVQNTSEGSAAVPAQAQATQAQASACPVSVQYNVNLGQGQNTATVPIFVATITIQNNDHVAIQGWRMGWQFPYNSTIKSPSDIFDSGITLLTPGSTTAVLDSPAGRNSSVPILEGGGTRQFGFLGTKGAEPLTQSNPFNVGPISNMAFNNLLCSMINANDNNNLGKSQQNNLAVPNAMPGASVANPTHVQIQYTPIQYVGQPLVNTYTQFLVRISNIQNASTLELSQVGLQYWFQGPDGLIPPAISASPWDFFEGRCDWATTGCAGVVLGISRGYENVNGAHFALNVTFNNDSGTLLPTGDGAVPALFLGTGLDVMDILLTITTKSGITTLNSTQDYSFLDTPILQQQINATTAATGGNVTSTIVPRRAEPNVNIPAFLDGSLVWGNLPTPLTSTNNVSAAMGMGTPSSVPVAEFGSSGAKNIQSSSSKLPDGLACQTLPGPAGTNVTQQSCSLQAVYCCTSPDPASPSVDPIPPRDWPPRVGPTSVAPPGAEVSLGTPASEVSTSFPVGLPAFPPLPPPSVPPESNSPPGSNSLGQQTNTSTNNNTGGGSVAWVAGIAVGIAVGGVVAAGAVIAWRRRRARARRGDTGDPNTLDIIDGRGKGTDGAIAVVLPVNGMPQSGFNDAVVMKDRLLASVPYTKDGTPLYKYPSGVSTTSRDASARSDTDPSAVLDTFSSDGGTRTLPGSPYVRVGMLGGSGGERRGGLQSESSDPSAGPLPSNVLLLLERKAQTAPSLISTCFSRRRKSGKGLSNSSYSDDDNDDCDSDSGGGSRHDGLSFSILRSSSWDGTLHDPRATDSWSHLERIKRRKSQPDKLPVKLPPLSPLPIPFVLHPSGGPPPDIDLDLDWETELEGKLGRCLGTGGFGSVFEAQWRGREVAVKMLPPLALADGGSDGGSAAYEALLREIRLASNFDCERLVKVYGACTRDKNKCCLIMELIRGGSLFHRIYDRNKRRLGYLEILQLAHDIAEGLAYLHPTVVHRDLKPQNVLIDDEGRAKLADFGISRVKDPTKSYFTQVTSDNGTPCYMAPEMMNGTRIDEKVDVYALGCILNEAWTRRQPWRESSHFFQIVLRVAVNGERPWMDPDCPEGLRRLITKCWHQDPRQRPSCADVMRLTDLLIQEELHRWEPLVNLR